MGKRYNVSEAEARICVPCGDMDWYSRYVLLWRISNAMDVSFCGKVMEEAFGNGCPEIFNSDKGSQFTSNDFTGILLSKEIAISMDGRGRTFDNIFMERLWKSVKYEEVYLKDYEICRDAREGLEKYFYFITIVGIINHWSIKHRTKFILEFLTGTNEEKAARGWRKVAECAEG
ncbi:MAG: transposase family protein [Candidatus Brocadia sp.]|jgi:putative transposase